MQNEERGSRMIKLYNIKDKFPVDGEIILAKIRTYDDDDDKVNYYVFRTYKRKNGTFYFEEASGE